MDADALFAATDPTGRTDGAAMRAVLDALSATDRERVYAVVATSGTTNVGAIDDLAGIGEVAQSIDTWFHVDGAYGAAALCAPSARHLFAGIEKADSLIVDPHKWLFGPYDCCALVYRDPGIARRAHTQSAEYLDVLHQDRPTTDEQWNPADLAHHLTRRARGLPLWFSLAMHGTDAYADAMEETLRVTREAADVIRKSEHLELLLEPQLSILVFKRRGWVRADYERWSDTVLQAGLAFVVPTQWQGATVLRMCIVNPRTTVEGLTKVFDSLRANPT
jgi:glutamate/tyrosine decarboxylase-like PLP-dependent enzyme